MDHTEKGWRLLITAAVKAFEIINLIELSDMKFLELCKTIFMT